MPTKTVPFEIAEHLQTDAYIQGFLKEVVETGNSSDFLHALKIAARAKGITEVAQSTGVSRASLYKSLADTGNPRFETIRKIVEALGCKLVVA